MRNESGNVKGNIPGKQEGERKSVISREHFIEEQSNDKELLDLFKIALTPVEAEKVSVGYLIKDNILMRKWSPTECGEKWLDCENGLMVRNGLMRNLRNTYVLKTKTRISNT